MQITLLLESECTKAFDAIRKKYYPKHLNKNHAHITIIYKIDESQYDIIKEIKTLLSNYKTFFIDVEKVQCNNKGNQINIASIELQILHTTICELLGNAVFRKDKLPFLPHITIQNGVTNYKARRSTHAIAAEIPKGPFKAIGAVCTYFQTTPKGQTETILFQ